MRVIRMCGLFLTVFFSHAACASADTVYLKNGRKIEGQVIEKTASYAKISYHNVDLTFWLDEIDRICQTRDVEDAFQSAQDCLALANEQNNDDFRKASQYLQEGAWEDAAELFFRIISANPDHAGAQFNLGCVYALSGEYDKALKEFEKTAALEKNVFKAFSYFNSAGIYAKKALVEKDPALFKTAADYFKKAGESLPHFVLANDYARHCETFAGMSDTAEKISFSSLEIGAPPDSALFLQESEIRGSGEQRSYVFNEESPALLYFYHSPTTQWLVCLSALSGFKPEDITEESQDFLKKLLQNQENEYNSRLNKLVKRNILIMLSNISRAQGRWDEAIDCAQKALDLGFQYSAEYINLGFAYFQKGDYVRAHESARQALQLNKESDARNLLEEIKKKAEAKILSLLSSS